MKDISGLPKGVTFAQHVWSRFQDSQRRLMWYVDTLRVTSETPTCINIEWNGEASRGSRRACLFELNTSRPSRERFWLIHSIFGDREHVKAPGENKYLAVLELIFTKTVKKDITEALANGSALQSHENYISLKYLKQLRLPYIFNF